MSKKTWLWQHSPVARIIFILILLYAICSINVLFLAIGIISYLPKSFLLDPHVLIAFAIISFALTVLTSAYHLSTMILRRKRRSDWQDTKPPEKA
jgi:predicted membrane protein